MTLYLAAGLLILATIFVVINHTKAKDALKKKPRVDPPSAEPTNGGKNFSVVTASASVTTHMAPTRVVPPELAALKLTKIADLSQPQIDLLTARLQDIPRPPHALDKLVSAEFLATATSTELNDLMVGEPQIAAKVLASVNSPMYGLKKPLGSIGQAATYLGMNTVRSICMQHMLDRSFQVTSSQSKVFYASIWNASAFASELCFKLAQLMQLPEPGHLVTQVVLSYLGPLATSSVLAQEDLARLTHSELIERTHLEQEKLGLSAGEIGTLLMQAWNVPQSLIQDVQDMGHILLTPCKTPVDARSARLALCYLCNRLGAMLASGELTDTRNFEVSQSERVELFFLQDYLKHASLARLEEFLKFPEVVSAVNLMATAALLRGQGN